MRLQELLLAGLSIFLTPRMAIGQGRMAVNLVKGLQGNDPKYLKTVATAKHYAVHSGPEFSRHIDNVYVNNHDLYDTCLPAFKAVIKDANAQWMVKMLSNFTSRIRRPNGSRPMLP